MAVSDTSKTERSTGVSGVASHDEVAGATTGTASEARPINDAVEAGRGQP